jgi:hypothetical protein
MIISCIKTECVWALAVIAFGFELIIAGYVRYDDEPSDMNVVEITAKLECDSDYLNVMGYTEAVEYNERVECAHDLGNSIWFGALVKREDKMADPIPLENYKITKNCKD